MVAAMHASTDSHSDRAVRLLFTAIGLILAISATVAGCGSLGDPTDGCGSGDTRDESCGPHSDAVDLAPAPPVSAPTVAMPSLPLASVSQVSIAVPRSTVANAEPAHARIPVAPGPSAVAHVVAPAAATARNASDGPWTQALASSTDARWLALRSPDRLVRSGDGGHSWQEAPFQLGRDARALMLDNGSLAILDGATVRWWDWQGATTNVTVRGFGSTLAWRASGTALVWVGERAHGRPSTYAIGVSRDRGATWRWQDAPSRGNEGNEIRADRDGTLRWMGASEAACGGGNQFRYRGHIDGRDWLPDDWTLDTPGDWAIGTRNAAYGVEDAPSCAGAWPCASRTLLGVRNRRTDALLTVGNHRGYTTLSAEGNGTVDVVSFEHRLVRVTDAGARAIVPSVPEGFRLAAVDSRGDPIGIVRGTAQRWNSTGHAWVPLGPAIPTHP